MWDCRQSWTPANTAIGIDYLEHLKKQNTELQRDNTLLRRDLAILRGDGEDVIESYSAAFKPGGIYGVTLDAAGNATTNDANLGDSVVDPALEDSTNTDAAAALVGLEDQDMPQVGQNELPLDTDAIRESLTQVGERVE